jgi:hypothetical protein
MLSRQRRLLNGSLYLGSDEVEARMLGRRDGRYYVLTEKMIDEMIRRGGK